MDIKIPEKFNAVDFLLDRHLEEGRGDKTAIVCQGQEWTYKRVFQEVNRLGNGFKSLGVEMENRVLLLSPDLPELISSILAAMKIGAVPVVTNTMLPAADIAYILNDSRAKVAVVHQSLLPLVEQVQKDLDYLQNLVVIGEAKGDQISYQKLVEQSSQKLETAKTSKNDSAVWQYSSGTTGTPKGIVHMHKNIYYHFHSHAKGILNITSEDKVFSVAKLFFGYGQGNGLYWPFGAGATTILLPDRPEPENVAELVTKERPTVYCGVPTSYNAILQMPDLTERYDFSSIRVCTSAGEALPAALYQKWLETFGVEIIDGIGSTECFHVFISNRPGQVVSGSTGKPIPGFEAKLVDDQGKEVPPGEIGNLLVKGGSVSAGYWNKHELTQRAFQGEWVRTGDKFYKDENGYYWFAGRMDDMIKAGGIWVSPIEVEGVLISHPAVLECGVIGAADKEGLLKPKAFIVLKEGNTPSAELTKEIQNYVKENAAPFKYPRWVEYVDELPKTPTGKLQRFKLRELDSSKKSG